MFSSRIFHFFLVVLGAIAVAQALDRLGAAHEAGAGAALARRREDNGAVVPAVVGPAKRQNTGGEDPDQTGQADETDTPSPTPTDDEPTDEPTPTTPSSTTPTRTRTTPRPTSSSTTDEEETSTSEEPEEETPPPVTEVETRIITTTNSDGSIETRTTEEAAVVTPGKQDDGGGNGGSGMSASTRNTVIGVVVGIGGAIVLGALAFVAWRIWGRRRGHGDDDGNDHLGYGGTAPYAPMDKSEAGSSSAAGTTGVGAGRNPFQSTLETYHAPTQVNASSNF